MANFTFNTENPQETCENILQQIVVNPQKVLFRTNYGRFYAETGLNAISDAYIDINPSNYELYIKLYFAETMPQAREFYGSVDYGKISQLSALGWEIYPNLNLSYVATKLMWFESLYPHKYFDYWKNNPSNIRQQDKKGAFKILEDLDKQGIVFFGIDKQAEFKREFTDTERETVNFNPSFCLQYTIGFNKIFDVNFLCSNKIKEGLSILNEQQRFLK